MNKGFTLIELLAVIVVIAILSSISTVVVRDILINSKDNLTEIQKNYIEEAAKQYYLREGMDKNVTCVNVSELLEKEYFNAKEIKDPKNSNNKITGSVKITNEANSYSYKYQTNLCE